MIHMMTPYLISLKFVLVKKLTHNWLSPKPNLSQMNWTLHLILETMVIYALMIKPSLLWEYEEDVLKHWDPITYFAQKDPQLRLRWTLFFDASWRRRTRWTYYLIENFMMMTWLFFALAEYNIILLEWGTQTKRS